MLLIHFHINIRFRNDGKFMWDGNKVIQLDFDIYDYGAVPSEFVVSETEFSPNYWLENITCNSYYWPSLEIRNQVCKTLVYDDEFTHDSEWHGRFLFHGEVVNVIVDEHHKIMSDFIKDENIIKEKIMILPFSFNYKNSKLKTKNIVFSSIQL